MEFDVKTLVTAVLTAFSILGGQRGFMALQNWRAQRTEKQQPSPPSHWADITGEQRPVLSSECEARHAKLADELQRGSDRFAEVNRGIADVREDVLEMRGDLRAGFASIPGEISKAAQAVVDRHEKQLHKD